MSFRIDNTNIDHLLDIGSVKYDVNKKRIIQELYHRNNVCTPRLISLLKRVKW